jgi:6-pyruvoyltetrahydropterin/6-carboxytetrahydropterin synthase
MFEVWKEFKFDCAHTLDGGNQGDHRYKRLHGHSYQAEVWLRGDQTVYGWVVDMGELEKRLSQIAKKLDHSFLNDIESLGPPTMENLAAFIWRDLDDLPALFKVTVRRDSLNEGCTYFGSTITEVSPLDTSICLKKESAHA